MHRFGPFEVDFTSSELRKNAIRVRIQEQPLRVLEALLLRPGELVTREELRDRLWPSDTFVDFEPSLNAAVAKLRQALNDSAEQPLYVETLARKGYRFIAPLGQPAGPPELPPIVEPAPAAVAIRKSNFLPWIVVGVLASCLALSWWVLWRTLRTAEEKPLVWLDLDVADDVSQPTVSPDGMKIIFVTRGRLAVRRVDQAQIRSLPGTEGASSPFFSPSGQWVGFFANRKLWKIALDGGAPVELCDAPVGRGASWGEDGRIIAALNATGGLSSVPASGGDPQLMTELGGGDPRVTNHRWPHALPNGKGVLFVAGTGPAIGSLQVLPPGGRSAKTLVEHSSGGRYLSSGHLVYDQNGTLFAAPMDLNRLELKAPPMPLLEGVAYDHFRGAEFDVSSSGTLVYRKSSAGPNRIVAWLDSTGGMEPILAKPGDYSSPRVSPDGKRLALVANWEGQPNLWIYEFARSSMTRLSFEPKPQCCLAWTPNGEYLAFSSGGNLAWVRSDGNGKVERLPASDLTGSPWSFSPAGNWVALFRLVPQTGFDLWVAPVESAARTLRVGTPKSLLREPGTQAAPAISPNGRWLAYTSDESGRPEIYVIPFAPLGPASGGKRQVSHEGGMAPIWSRDGRELYFRGLHHRLLAASCAVKGDSLVIGAARVWSERPLADIIGAAPSVDAGIDNKHVVAVLDTDAPRSDETHLRVLLHVNEEIGRRARAHRKE